MRLELVCAACSLVIESLLRLSLRLIHVSLSGLLFRGR